MENINIKQIITREWIGKNGDKMVEVIGLGSDDRIYRWHKGTGTWVLDILNK